jgi:hypothetical protein
VSRVLHRTAAALPSGGLQADEGAIPPEPLQLIKTTLIFVENVDNELAKIQQNPATFRFAFAPEQLMSDLKKVILNAV